MANLALEKVSKSFGSVQVLSQIDITLPDGEFLVLVGPSGCGKSTLMNIVAGLEEPSTGRIVLGGRDVTELGPSERNISMVFQSYALYPNMTVAENIAFPLEMRGVPKADRAKKVDEVATLLQIGHLLTRKPRQLSGGQRQRVAIGRALAREPQLFLFDEPLSNLDAKLRVDMRAEIKRLHMRTGVTTIYVTHDQVEAMTLGTRIAVLKGGAIQQLATPLDLYEKPANLFVAEFIGSPSINTMKAAPDEAGLLRLPNGHAVHFGAEATGGRGRSSREVLVGVRPEDFELRGGPDGKGGDGGDAMAGKISLIEPTGPETYMEVDLGFKEITVRLAGRPSLALGSTVRLAIPPAAVHLFDAESGARLN